MKKLFLPAVFLAVGLVIGFGAGVYTLPILIDRFAEKQQLAEVTPAAETDPTGMFDPDSPGSDPLHWGEGTVRVSNGMIVFESDVAFAPGPDYRIYLTRKFVERIGEFEKIKPNAIQVAKLKTFAGPLEFDLPADLNIHEYDNVVIWCETFSMYIASARLE